MKFLVGSLLLAVGAFDALLFDEREPLLIHGLVLFRSLLEILRGLCPLGRALFGGLLFRGFVTRGFPVRHAFEEKIGLIAGSLFRALGAVLLAQFAFGQRGG